MTVKVEAKNHLSDSFYITPSFARQVMTRRETRETLLATQGRILACGEMWDVMVKHLGAGMYGVTAGRTWRPKTLRKDSK